MTPPFCPELSVLALLPHVTTSQVAPSLLPEDFDGAGISIATSVVPGTVNPAVTHTSLLHHTTSSPPRTRTLSSFFSPRASGACDVLSAGTGGGTTRCKCSDPVVSVGDRNRWNDAFLKSPGLCSSLDLVPCDQHNMSVGAER